MAEMIKPAPFRDRPDEQFIGEPVGLDPTTGAATNLQTAITKGLYATNPWPATVGLLNLGPEARYHWLKYFHQKRPLPPPGSSRSWSRIRRSTSRAASLRSWAKSRSWRSRSFWLRRYAAFCRS